MLTAKTKTVVAGCLVMMVLTSGCTNWKKKYQSLEVEHQNTLGLLERERAEKGQMAEQYSQGQKTINDLQAQIEQRNQTPAEATGFGEGYDVTFDPTAGTVTVTLPNTILFAPGKSTLKQATIAELDHIFSVVQSQYAGKKIDVVGHTDSDPIRKSSWKDNWELSAQRALEVTRYLLKRGMAADMIRAVGCGESLPVAPNTSASGKSQNRRVEIVVHMR